MSRTERHTITYQCDHAPCSRRVVGYDDVAQPSNERELFHAPSGWLVVHALCSSAGRAYLCSARCLKAYAGQVEQARGEGGGES
jgi:hypothetical protein